MDRLLALVKSPAAGATLAAVGALALMLSLVVAFRGPSAQSQVYIDAIGTLKTQKSAHEVRLRELSTELRVGQAELKGAASGNEALQDRADGLDAEIAAIREKRRKGRALLEKKADDLRTDEEKERRLQEFLERMRAVAVTVGVSGKPLRTGFFFELPGGLSKQRVVFTSSEDPLPEEGLFVTYKSRVLAGYVDKKGEAEIVYHDRPTSTVVLSLDLWDEEVELTSASWLADPIKGKKVYAVGYQFDSGSVLYQLSDGSVSSTEFDYNGRKRALMDFAANPGTVGSPVFDRDRKLVGLVVGASNGKAVAITGSQLKELLKRIPDR